MRTTCFALLVAFAIACSAPDTVRDSGTTDARHDTSTVGDVARPDVPTVDSPTSDGSAIDSPLADVPSTDSTSDVPNRRDVAVDILTVDVPRPDVIVRDGGGGPGTVCTGSLAGECSTGLLCCYPCGIPDCERVCMMPDPRTGRCPMFM